MHYVYCWELGSDLGHIHLLALLGRALKSRGHRFSAVVSDTGHAWNYLNSLDIPWYQAPQARLPLRNTHPLNHADILAASGYQDAQVLSGKLCAWRALLAVLKPDCVIGEAAPTAMLMARIMGLRNISLDMGFFCPPLSDPLPPLRDWVAYSNDDLIGRERQVLSVINQALSELGYPQLSTFASIFEGETYWLTWPEINHFGYHSPDRHLGPICSWWPGTVQDWPAGQGEKIFAYLKADCPESIPALEWCLRQGYRVSAYLPRWPLNIVKRFADTKRVAVSAKPLDLKFTLSSCDKVLCHAGTGTVTHSLSLGKSLLLLPTQIEQLRTARAAANNKLAVLPVRERAGLNFDSAEMKVCYQQAKCFSVNKSGMGSDSLSRLLEILG